MRKPIQGARRTSVSCAHPFERVELEHTRTPFNLSCGTMGQPIDDDVEYASRMNVHAASLVDDVNVSLVLLSPSFP